MACQIDYLCELPDNRERCLALESLPPDLKSTYERILKRVNETNIHVRALVQRTLRWLIVAKEKLAISALREALSMKDGTQRLDRDAVPDEFVLLRACSSLVRKSTPGQELELAHFTVKEFLLGIDCDSDFSAYRVDVEESEVELGKACLTYLTLQDFDSRLSWSREARSKRFQEYAFRHYAVKYSFLHVGGHLGDPDLLTLTQKLIDPSKPGTFTTWAQDHRFICVSREDDHPLWDTKTVESTYSEMVKSTPLHYASALALPEICKWLLDCGCEVDQMSRFGPPITHAILGPGSLVAYGGKHPMVEGQHERKLKVVDILLEAGADPNGRSRENIPALHYAFFECPELDVTLRLVRKGARYTEEGAFSYSTYPTGSAKKLLNKIGRENLHADDYALLLQYSIEDSEEMAKWGWSESEIQEATE